MKTQKRLNVFALLIAFVTGYKCYVHFDFATFTFEKPVLDTIYLIAFLFSFGVLIRDFLTTGKDKS